MRSITITPVATPGDRDEATALVHDYLCWLDAATGIDLLAAQPELRDDLARLDAAADPVRDADPDQSMLLARRSEVVVGMVEVRWRGRGEAELKRLYVRPVARGFGVADRLVRIAVDAARAHGGRRMWLETLPGAMDRAIAVYRRHGFEPAARAPHLGVPGVVVMERELTSAIRCA